MIMIKLRYQRHFKKPSLKPDSTSGLWKKTRKYRKLFRVFPSSVHALHSHAWLVELRSNDQLTNLFQMTGYDQNGP